MSDTTTAPTTTAADAAPKMVKVKNNVREILKSCLDPENPIHVPPAKVKNVITNGAEGINTVVKERVAPYKEDHRKYTALSREVKDGTLTAARKDAITKELAALQANKDLYDVLNHEKIRINAEAMLSLSMISENVLRELISFAFDTCTTLGSKQVDATHLHKEEACKLPIWRLIKRLPSWIKFPNEFLPKTRARKTDGADDTGNSDDTTSEPNHDAEVNEKRTNFNYYAKEICRMFIDKNEKYSKLRISHTLTEYCDRLLTEFLNLLARQFHACIVINEQKTLSNNLVYAVLQLLMLDDQRLSVDFTVKNEKVKETTRDANNNETTVEVERLVARKTLRTADGYYENLCETVQRQVDLFNKYYEEHPGGEMKEAPPPKPPKVKKTPEELAAEAAEKEKKKAEKVALKAAKKAAKQAAVTNTTPTTNTPTTNTDTPAPATEAAKPTAKGKKPKQPKAVDDTATTTATTVAAPAPVPTNETKPAPKEKAAKKPAATSTEAKPVVATNTGAEVKKDAAKPAVVESKKEPKPATTEVKKEAVKPAVVESKKEPKPAATGTEAKKEAKPTPTTVDVKPAVKKTTTKTVDKAAAATTPATKTQ